MQKEQLYGREIVVDAMRLERLNANYPELIATPCIVQKRCQRCESVCLEVFACASCQSYCRVCVACLQMGLIKACCHLVHLAVPMMSERSVAFHMSGELSKAQENISQLLVESLQDTRPILLSAVTGAGKTEMICQVILTVLQRGGRVCVCAPRVDVVLELAPRLQMIFPSEKIVVLYGEQTEQYRYAAFVVCTTHQLLRFKNAFDLLIVDEVDSFPFRHNRMLEQRVPKVMRSVGKVIYLTATPTKEQLTAIRRKQLVNVTLPARYHRHRLPEPKCVYVGDFRDVVRLKNRIFVRLLEKQLQQQRRTVIFFPHIQQMEMCYERMVHFFASKTDVTLACVSAKDVYRHDKVNAMREERYDFLLTTTILERGVTFSNIDVIVCGCDHALYTSESLVQIAGRVGRKADFPFGEVWFLHDGKTKAMKRAVSWIKRMNHLAKLGGMIDD